MSATEEAVAMATVAAQAAAAKLADDVVVIDVSGQLVITDCFVIASASNERQVNAIVDEVEEKMRLAGYKPARREGTREGRWCWRAPPTARPGCGTRRLESTCAPSRDTRAR